MASGQLLVLAVAAAFLATQHILPLFENEFSTPPRAKYTTFEVMRIRYSKPETCPDSSVRWTSTCESEWLCNAARIDWSDDDSRLPGGCWIDMLESGCGSERGTLLSSMTQLRSYLQNLTETSVLLEVKTVRGTWHPSLFFGNASLEAAAPPL